MRGATSGHGMAGRKGARIGWGDEPCCSSKEKRQHLLEADGANDHQTPDGAEHPEPLEEAEALDLFKAFVDGNFRVYLTRVIQRHLWIVCFLDRRTHGSCRSECIVPDGDDDVSSPLLGRVDALLHTVSRPDRRRQAYAASVPRCYTEAALLWSSTSLGGVEQRAPA